MIDEEILVMMPIEPDEQMRKTAEDVIKLFYSDENLRSEAFLIWLKTHRAISRDMIATNEKNK